MTSLSAERKFIEDARDPVVSAGQENFIRHYTFPEGTILFQKGEERHCAFLIGKGSVHIFGNDEGGEDKRLCVLGNGEIFGEMALVDNAPRTATAITAEETEVYIIPQNVLKDRLQGLDPVVSLLINILIERYRLTRIYMPESIKQEGIDDFVKKISAYDRKAGQVMKLEDIQSQKNSALEEIKLEQDIRLALDNREFVPVLQPILEFSTKKILGFESLIRWDSPEKGMVFPNDFIPVAERTGVVEMLDFMMLEKACELIPTLHASIPENNDFYISVNFSGANFVVTDVVDIVSKTLKKYKTNPDNICIEVTESALIHDPEKAEKALQGLKNLGVRIALDDFGTGYSSMGYLHKFTFDVLKIDRSFIMGLHDGKKSLDIVQAIIGLAKTFDVGIIAEGIERDKDVAALQALGCDIGQGYLFSKPMSVTDAIDFLKNYKINRS